MSPGRLVELASYDHACPDCGALPREPCVDLRSRQVETAHPHWARGHDQISGRPVTTEVEES